MTAYSSLPPRSKPMKRSPPYQSGPSPDLAGVTIITGGGQVVPFRKPQRPKDTIPANVRRMVMERDMGLCVYTGKPADHIHHRRLRGIGGSSAEHTHCPCNLVSLTFDAHEFVHRNRLIAEAEGLIIPRATPLPRLLPVNLHGFGNTGQIAWPSCGGEWLTYEPGGDGAA